MNVLVALGTMASAYTPQEDLLKVRYKKTQWSGRSYSSIHDVMYSSLDDVSVWIQVRMGHEARRD